MPGEIAEMMLDGTLCEACGCYMGDDHAPGFPQYCSPECASDRGADEAQVVKSKKRDDMPFFVVKNDGGIKALPRFLSGLGHQYAEEAADARGNPMFRLYHDKSPGKDHAWGVTKRGIVVVTNGVHLAKAREIINSTCRVD